MVLEYFTLKRGGKGKEVETPKSPVLNDEEEKFLEQITSEEQPPPLPQRPVVILEGGSAAKNKDAQIALMDGAETIPLPTSPAVETDVRSAATKPEDNMSTDKEKKGGKSDDGKKKKDYWAFVPAIGKMRGKNKDKQVAADSLASAAETVKSGGIDLRSDVTDEEKEAKKEQEDLTSILDQLNLAAVNNRVFSFSKESQELMDKFKLVLTDLINGVPTAYGDLEKLLKNSDEQLRNMFNNLPPFLQNLVKSLPTKMSAALAPEVLAAASEKPGADAKVLNAQSGLGMKKKARAKIPSLKKLVSQQGAVTAMLRSIMNFLKLRFPAFMTGTNVLLSLALFILLFVFWYCHKRGRETRLEKERLAVEASDSDVDASELEESMVLDSKNGESSDPPIKIHNDPTSGEQPSARVENLPSVLDLPEPRTVPLPQDTPNTEKDFAAGIVGQGSK